MRAMVNWRFISGPARAFPVYGIIVEERGICVHEKGHVSEDDLAEYHDINKRFHQVIIEASGNPAIADALARNEHLPFASVSSLAVDRNDLAREFRRFNFAHLQHHTVVDALLAGQGARAEAIMREHANATLRYARLFGGQDGPVEGLKILS